jgi:CheY-like chemotaxis protein
LWRPAVELEPNVWIGQEKRGACVDPRRLRVLVVDGDARAAGFLERLLHTIGYPETRVAYTGRAAIMLAEEFRPEVVLADIDMPDIDESALSRTLRERAQFCNMCFVAVSGRGAHQDAQVGHHIAPTQRLLKPITAGDLSACLLYAAAKRR